MSDPSCFDIRLKPSVYTKSNIPVKSTTKELPSVTVTSILQHKKPTLSGHLEVMCISHKLAGKFYPTILTTLKEKFEELLPEAGITLKKERKFFLEEVSSPYLALVWMAGGMPRKNFTA